MNQQTKTLAQDSASARIRRSDMKLEVVTIPVSDVDRATKFYVGLGWRQDATPPGSGVVQVTPPGSACSIHFGKNRTAAVPGSVENLILTVSDILAARDELMRRGVEVSEVFHRTKDGVARGPDPNRLSYNSLATFSDPDGNRWLMQEITTRLPGRIDVTETTFASASDLSSAFRRAELAHGEHEKRTGQRDANWADWYAEYMVAEQSGAKLPE
jgi:catechol 2,3-dioxygenase-like lactoylglutathione lyase family enzyme